MTGRELIKFILENRLENSKMVFHRVANTDHEVWREIDDRYLCVGRGLLIFEHPDNPSLRREVNENNQ
jgi:hypothetical protein